MSANALSFDSDHNLGGGAYRNRTDVHGFAIACIPNNQLFLLMKIKVCYQMCYQTFLNIQQLFYEQVQPHAPPLSTNTIFESLKPFDPIGIKLRFLVTQLGGHLGKIPKHSEYHPTI